jgi:integrase
LVAKALAHLESLGYRRGVLLKYRNAWLRLISLAEEKPVQRVLSEELRERLLDYYKVPEWDSPRPMTSWQRHVRTAVRVLWEFSVHGCYQRRRRVAEKTLLPPTFEKLLREYEKFALERLSVRPGTIARRRISIAGFLHFFDSKGGRSVGRITPVTVSEFTATRAHHHPHTIATLLSDLRSFLRFLLMRGFLNRDLSNDLPKIRVRPDMYVPSVWNGGDVDRLLAAVDRSSPSGKRDYAILLLACRLGLRVGDIRTLRLEHLDWSQSRLEMPQSKTGVPVSLPLPEELGQALIDYLKNGRPKSHHREVFLRATAPFGPFAQTDNLYHIIKLWRRRAGVPIPKKRGRYGLHSLRHTLATRLLEAETPLQTIADIIGHLSLESTRRYAKADVQALRSVALDPEEVARA